MTTNQPQPPPSTTNTAAAAATPVTAYPQPTNPHHRPGPNSPNHIAKTFTHLGKRLEHAAKQAGSFTENLYTHLRAGGADGTLSRLARSTRVLTEGGSDRLFRQTFPDAVHSGEKLQAAYVCNLSTTVGPVTGTLYISDRRVAFSSDQPLRIANTTSGGGGYHYTTGVSWCHYKVVVAVEELEAVNASANAKNPAEKYVQVVARGGHEFWFVGFVFYDKALKDLRKAMQHHWCSVDAYGKLGGEFRRTD